MLNRLHDTSRYCNECGWRGSERTVMHAGPSYECYPSCEALLSPEAREEDRRLHRRAEERIRKVAEDLKIFREAGGL